MDETFQFSSAQQLNSLLLRIKIRVNSSLATPELGNEPPGLDVRGEKGESAMSKLTGACALLSASMAVSGCATTRMLEAQSRVDPQTIALYNVAGGADTSCPATYADYIWDDKQQKWVRNRLGTRFRAPGDFHDGALPVRCLKDQVSGKDIYSEALPAANAVNAQATARNRLSAILMKHSDDVCTVELGRLTAREAMVNTFGSILTSGLSTAASVVSPETLKSVLAGGASFTNATRTHINSEVYRNVLSTAVSKAIQNKRDEQRAAILGHFHDAADAYTVDQMIMEVNDYHQSCSFYRGLGLVIEAVSRPTDSASEQLLRAEVALANRQIQVGSLERQLAAIPKDAKFDQQRADTLARLKNAQEGYDQAVDTLAQVGSAPKPVAPPADQGEGNDSGTDQGGTGDGGGGQDGPAPPPPPQPQPGH